MKITLPSAVITTAVILYVMVLVLWFGLPLPLSSAQRAEMMSYAPTEEGSAVFQSPRWEVGHSDQVALVEIIVVSRRGERVSVVRYFRLNFKKAAVPVPKEPREKIDREPPKTSKRVFA